MLQQIVSRTPIWVWGLLAFLIWRGLVASVDREIRFKQAFVIPVVMLALSVQGIVTGFGAHPAAAPIWLACLIASAALTWQLFDTGSVDAHPERGTVTLRGSWLPLMLIVGIFMIKYATNVALAIQPGLREQVVFVASTCAVFGAFNGMFVGQMFRIASIYRKDIARTNNFL